MPHSENRFIADAGEALKKDPAGLGEPIDYVVISAEKIECPFHFLSLVVRWIHARSLLWPRA